MTYHNLTQLIALINKDRHVESVRLVHESDFESTLMITPVIQDRRSTHRLQGVMRRALQQHGASETLEVEHIQRPPVVEKRVYINERRHNEPRFSHYAHNEWEVALTASQNNTPSIHFDPFNPRRHIKVRRKVA